MTLTDFEEAIKANTEGLTMVSTGICSGCDTCRSEYAPDDTLEQFDERVSSGEFPNEPYFSWRPCDLCGSSLGGDREPWHAVDGDGEIIHGEYACVDCIMYLANGDLPEHWE